jgi:hypothetical protein
MFKIVSEFNKTQKIGFFITLLLILLIVMFHYPFGGYAIIHTIKSTCLEAYVHK